MINYIQLGWATETLGEFSKCPHISKPILLQQIFVMSSHASKPVSLTAGCKNLVPESAEGTAMAQSFQHSAWHSGDGCSSKITVVTAAKKVS